MEQNFISADYHTHTIFSHGKGTILENVLEAKSKGLKAVAITDHGFGQPFAGITPDKFVKMKQEVASIQKEYPGIQILLGVEANIINMLGEIDLTPDQFKEMDIVLAGYHLSATQIQVKNAFNMVLPAMFGHFNICTKAQKERNTKAYLNMIKNYKIDVVTHPGFNLPLNYTELGDACADYGTYIEISSRHKMPNKEGLEELLKTKAQFIVNSDAHKVEQVGVYDYAVNLVKEYNIQDRVINVGDKKLVLRSKQ